MGDKTQPDTFYAFPFDWQLTCQIYYFRCTIEERETKIGTKRAFYCQIFRRIDFIFFFLTFYFFVWFWNLNLWYVFIQFSHTNWNLQLVRNWSVYIISARRLCIFNGIEWYEIIKKTNNNFVILLLDSIIENELVAWWSFISFRRYLCILLVSKNVGRFFSSLLSPLENRIQVEWEEWMLALKMAAAIITVCLILFFFLLVNPMRVICFRFNLFPSFVTG